MPVVMPYPWRIALFAGDNSTYCWRIATFARGNMLPLANVAMRQHVTPGECCNALGIIILCASKNNYSSRKINFIQQIIHRITAAKQGIIFTSDQDSNITNKSPILHTSVQDSNIHKLHKFLIRTYKFYSGEYTNWLNKEHTEKKDSGGGEHHHEEGGHPAPLHLSRPLSR
jgi:hypothetical protein